MGKPTCCVFRLKGIVRSWKVCDPLLSRRGLRRVSENTCARREGQARVKAVVKDEMPTRQKEAKTEEP